MAGLGAAYELSKQAQAQSQILEVVLYEKSKTLGGLAYCTTVAGQPLEAFYHHMFPNYHDFFEIAPELGIEDTIFFKRAKSGIFHDGKAYPFDSVVDLLRFSPL